jgi:Family of unknown function (DUF5683)
MLRIGLVLLFAGLCFPAWCQVKADSVIVEKDTTLISKDAPIDTIRSYAKRFDPRKALLYAAVLPGSGQIYNKKYWKLPLVYGGFGLLIYSVNFYQSAYVKYKSELFITINDPTQLPPSGLPQDQLRSIVDQARRQRDFYIVLTGLIYILQMVDAHVDAHLKEFDLNPKLQVKVEPRMTQDLMIGRSSGFAILFRF